MLAVQGSTPVGMEVRQSVLSVWPWAAGSVGLLSKVGMRGALPCGVCVLPVPNGHSWKEQEHSMDGQSVTNALSAVLPLHTGRAGGVGAGSTLDAPASSCACRSKGTALIAGRMNRFAPH